MVVSRNSTNIKEVKQHSIITPQIQLFFYLPAVETAAAVAVERRR